MNRAADDSVVIGISRPSVSTIRGEGQYATDGEDTFEQAKSVKPALILLDVVMPKVDGFAACRKLKKDADTANIPVVMVTAKSTESDKFWGERQGCDAYITKPFTPEQLMAAIKRFLP